MKPRRLAMAAVVAAGAGLILTSCASTAPYAVIVNGSRVGQTTLLKELHALGANPSFVSAYEGAGRQVWADASHKTYAQSFTAVVLNTDIQAQLVHDEVARRHLEPPVKDINSQKIKDAAAQQFPSDPKTNKPVFQEFDPWFQHEYQVRVAEEAALGNALPKVASDDAAIQKFYADNPQDFITTECVSHILVATQQLANSIRAQLVSGGDFAALARKNSTDPGSAVKGGDLGCNAPGNYVTAFEQVADTIPVNEISQPVHTQFGWHIIKVTSRQLQPLSAVRTAIQQHLQQESPITVFLQGMEKSLNVKVNPAYGTWQTGQGVVPPAAPPAKAGAPSTTTQTPSVQAPSGTGAGQTTPTSTP